MNKDKEKRNYGGVIIYVAVLLGFFSMGVVGGMILQQGITQSTLMKVANNLDGVQIDIDLNETEIIKGITDFYEPYFDEMLNKSNSSNVFLGSDE